MGISGNRGSTLATGNPFEDAIANTSMKVEQGRTSSLGTFLRFEDGRTFRRVQANGTIDMGDLVEMDVSNDQALEATDFGLAAAGPIAGEGGSIGDTAIRIAENITGIAANEYAGGFVSVTAGTGLGQLRRIKSHNVTDAVDGCLLQLYDPLQLALSNSSVGNLSMNDVEEVLRASTLTNTVMGLAVAGAVAGDHMWIQTWGRAIGRAAEAITAGEPLGADAEHGEFAPKVAAGTDATGVLIGIARTAQAAENGYFEVDLRITP